MAGYVQDCILLLGDSLTQGGSAPYGFAQQLGDVYNRKLDVLYRGLSGYNTTWIFPVFEQMFAKKKERQNLPKVQLLTIWFGANDACLPGGQQHVPLPLFSQNLSKLIHMVKDPKSEWYSPETRIILFTPPPLNTHQWIQHLKTRDSPAPRDTLDRSVAATRSYADAVIQVGKKEGVPVIDTFTLLWDGVNGDEKKLNKYLLDGLHLNEDAYKLIYTELIACISKNYPEIHYEKLEMVYPIWEDITNDNYKELLKSSLVRK